MRRDIAVRSTEWLSTGDSMALRQTPDIVYSIVLPAGLGCGEEQ
jgi:hypothetical protein